MTPRLMLCTGFLLAVTVGCGKHEKPNFTYMPDMAFSPAKSAQEEGAMRVPPEGTVPRGYERYRYDKDPERAGRELKNPLRRTRANLLRGQKLFNIYCIVCHGKGGQGDGTIIPKFPRPPSLLSNKVRNWPDGRIYHVITKGQNIMPSYATQVDPQDRWAIIHYVRVLQRAAKPTAEDLREYEREYK